MQCWLVFSEEPHVRSYCLYICTSAVTVTFAIQPKPCWHQHKLCNKFGNANPCKQLYDLKASLLWALKGFLPIKPLCWAG